MIEKTTLNGGFATMNHFQSKSDVLVTEDVPLKEIAAKVGTPV
jgi:hypothetical protein